MKKLYLIFALVILSTFTLSSCGWDTYLEEETNQAIETANKTGLSSAVVYQTQFAIDGLEKVMKDADPTNLTPTIEKIKYEWLFFSHSRIFYLESSIFFVLLIIFLANIFLI